MTGILFLKETPMENMQEAIIRYVTLIFDFLILFQLRYNLDVFGNKKQQSMLILNNSVVPRNLNKENDVDDDLNSDEFIVTQMQ